MCPGPAQHPSPGSPSRPWGSQLSQAAGKGRHQHVRAGSTVLEYLHAVQGALGKGKARWAERCTSEGGSSQHAHTTPELRSHQSWKRAEVSRRTLCDHTQDQQALGNESPSRQTPAPRGQASTLPGHTFCLSHGTFPTRQTVTHGHLQSTPGARVVVHDGEQEGSVETHIPHL